MKVSVVRREEFDSQFLRSFEGFFYHVPLCLGPSVLNTGESRHTTGYDRPDGEKQCKAQDASSPPPPIKKDKWCAECRVRHALPGFVQTFLTVTKAASKMTAPPKPRATVTPGLSSSLNGFYEMVLVGEERDKILISASLESWCAQWHVLQ